MQFYIELAEVPLGDRHVPRARDATLGQPGAHSNEAGLYPKRLRIQTGQVLQGS